MQLHMSIQQQKALGVAVHCLPPPPASIAAHPPPAHLPPALLPSALPHCPFPAHLISNHRRPVFSTAFLGPPFQGSGLALSGGVVGNEERAELTLWDIGALISSQQGCNCWLCQSHEWGVAAAACWCAAVQRTLMQSFVHSGPPLAHSHATATWAGIIPRHTLPRLFILLNRLQAGGSMRGWGGWAGSCRPTAWPT